MFKYFVIISERAHILERMPWFKECIPAARAEGHDDPGEDAWFVRLERWDDLMKDPEFVMSAFKEPTRPYNPNTLEDLK